MEVLTTIEAGGHTIDFGVATTREERKAVLAQRFRLYQREGYYHEGVTEDQDEYDEEAIYFVGGLRSAGPGRGFLVSSTRLIDGREDPGFEFPALKAFRFEMPAALREVPVRAAGGGRAPRVRTASGRHDRETHHRPGPHPRHRRLRGADDAPLRPSGHQAPAPEGPRGLGPPLP